MHKTIILDIGENSDRDEHAEQTNQLDELFNDGYEVKFQTQIRESLDNNWHVYLWLYLHKPDTFEAINFANALAKNHAK